MEPTGLRRKDTTKGPPLRVLSLDGGGVRGYSMLILLQELMYKTYNETEGKPPTRDQIPKPCEYFDLIAGTGTGGLIAIMLGRLRLDLETCKDVYVRMTRKVFETDKTFAGIPYRSTLFKASKLEEAIRECVREHTIFEDEGNDGTNVGMTDIPMSPSGSVLSGIDKRQSVASSMRNGYDSMSPKSSYSNNRWGNPNASLYDSRENRTKTAITAVYKGTPLKGDSVLLRSYDSRKEPAPEFNCTIWQAGRATSATAVAFKPIQIGQSVFIDEGAGKYNPSPQILDEAIINEWPGRELGVFVSIGTGKRPASSANRNQHEWWEGFMGGGIGEFAEARRRLIAKIEGCEDTHQHMVHEHLPKRGVNPDNYYRLNVEVGVGEFGMNEWQRLADISTSTRRYLAKNEVKRIIEDAATKLAKIERAKRRQSYFTTKGELDGIDVPPPLETLAVELPGDEGRVYQSPRAQNFHGPRYTDVSSPQDKFSIVSPVETTQTTLGSAVPRRSTEHGQDNINRLSAVSAASSAPSQRPSHESQNRSDVAQAPPLPPKTPMQSSKAPTTNAGSNTPLSPVYSIPPRQNTIPKLPYPDDDGPPPVVNMAGKPEFRPR